VSNVAEIFIELRSKLTGAAAVTAIVPAARILHGWPPDFADAGFFPSMTFFQVSGLTPSVDQGPFRLFDGALQLDLWGYDPDELCALEVASRDALLAPGFAPTGWKESILRLGGTDYLFAQESQLHRRLMTVIVKASAEA